MARVHKLLEGSGRDAGQNGISFLAALNALPLPGRFWLGLEAVHLAEDDLIDKCQRRFVKATRLPQWDVNMVNLDSHQA